MSLELKPKFYKLSSSEAASTLRDAYKEVVGTIPPSDVLLLLLNQTALETGGWSLPNYNWGGIKANVSSPYFQYLSCGEIVDGKERKWTADDRSPYCKFAAYKSAKEGAVAYIKQLKRKPNWWAGIQSGNVDDFISGMTSYPAYFTAAPSQYRKAMMSWEKTNNPLAIAFGGPAQGNWLTKFLDNLNIFKRLNNFFQI
jgi:hypothetical protein